MKSPNKKPKTIKTISILISILIVLMACLFVLVFVFINNMKRLVVRIIDSIPVVSSFIPETSDYSKQTETPSETEKTTTPTTEKTTSSFSEKTTARPVETSSPGFFIDTSRRYTHSSLNDDINKLASLYPDLISVSTVGKSVNNRAIKLIKLGKGEKKAFACAAIHAREIITSKYIMLCVFEYCEAYKSKTGKYGQYNVKELLEEYTIFIVPCANPDGMEIVGNKKVPNASISSFSRYEYKANTNGVDLNRNFPLAWERINNGITKPASYDYKGKSSASEPETKCLMSLCKNNSFEFAFSFHITGECVYWGDVYDTTNNNGFRRLAKRLSDLTGFYLTNESNDVNSYGGGFENWFRHTYKKPGFCIELISYEHRTSPTTKQAKLSDLSRS
ncbi:MAG TPA: M14 family zinc carboxypeptidase, partial [Clostridiales bacterium]|nr:M14 family zinc carboxypeptidase [Clostridiales bacterium]